MVQAAGVIGVEGLVPVVGANVAAVIPAYKTKPDKKTYFAFSSATGGWSTLEVSPNDSEPIVHAAMVVVTDGETTHVFKNDTGKWSTPIALVADNERSSVTTPKPTARSRPSASSAEEPNGHVHGLRYLLYAPDLEVYLVDLDADGVLDVVPIDGTTSSRPGEDQSLNGAWQMVREATRRRREVAEEQAALQESLGPQHPAMVKINARLADLEVEERDWIARLKAFAAPASFGRVTVIDWQSRLKSELQQAEQDAEQAAREVKSPKTSRDKDQAEVRLRESVGKAFASRQKLQQLEAELLRERLRQVDDRLQERGRLRDRIIQRRVEELTNSNLDWGASEPLGVSKTATPLVVTASSSPPRTGPRAEAVAIVNGEVIAYRDLVVWGMSLKELDGAVNLILLKQAAKQAKLDIAGKDIDDEVQHYASKVKLSIDQWYSMLEHERGISRDRYRETVIRPMLALKRLAGDDQKQQLTFLAGLRAAAKIELVDPDAKLRPIKSESGETDQPEEPPPSNNQNSPASVNNDPS